MRNRYKNFRLLRQVNAPNSFPLLGCGFVIRRLYLLKSESQLKSRDKARLFCLIKGVRRELVLESFGASEFFSTVPLTIEAISREK